MQETSSIYSNQVRMREEEFSCPNFLFPTCCRGYYKSINQQSVDVIMETMIMFYAVYNNNYIRQVV